MLVFAVLCTDLYSTLVLYGFNHTVIVISNPNYVFTLTICTVLHALLLECTKDILL